MRQVAATLATIFATIVLGGCSSSDEADKPSVATEPTSAKSTSDISLPERKSLTAAERAQVCRAAVADINGHSPSIMKIKSNSGKSVVVRYNRPDDGKAWTDECRFDGDRVVWRPIGAFGGTKPGRWRDSPQDEVIKFQIAGSKVTISTTYSGGSGGTQTYSVR